MTRRIGQPFTFFIGDHLDDADWERIEKASRLTFAPENRQRLATVIAEHLSAQAAYQDAPTATNLGKELSAICGASKMLAEALGALGDDAGRSAAGRHLRLHAAEHALQIPDDLEALRIEAHSLATTAASAIAKLPRNRKGAAGMPYLGKFIRDALEVFKAAGGKGSYTKPAIDFLQVVIELAGGGKRQPGAIKEQIDLALGTKSALRRDKIQKQS